MPIHIDGLEEKERTRLSPYEKNWNSLIKPTVETLGHKVSEGNI